MPERRGPVSRMTENARAARTSSVSRALRMVVIDEKYKLLVKISQSRWWIVILGTLFPSPNRLRKKRQLPLWPPSVSQLPGSTAAVALSNPSTPRFTSRRGSGCISRTSAILPSPNRICMLLCLTKSTASTTKTYTPVAPAQENHEDGCPSCGMGMPSRKSLLLWPITRRARRRERFCTATVRIANPLRIPVLNERPDRSAVNA